MIIEFIREKASLLVKGTERYMDGPAESLFTMQFSDIKLEGRFATGQEFLEAFENTLPCISKNVALTRNLSTAEKIALGKQEKLIAFYEFCVDRGVFGIEEEAKVFANYEDLKAHFADKINVWISKTTDLNYFDSHTKAALNADLYDPYTPSSLFTAVWQTVERLTRTLWVTEDGEEWGIYFIRTIR